MSFVRRYRNVPSQEQIQLISGVVLVDLPPPASIQGVGTGTVALVGEFADGTFAGKFDASGNFVTTPQPVQVFSSADLISKCGGWDETIGDIGNSGGNGFVDLRNKKFAALVAVPVNIFSSRGVRVFRDLPTNKSSTNPTPVVPMSPGTVSAGTQFQVGASRMRIGRQVNFTGTAAYDSGTDGAVTATAGAATHGKATNTAGPYVVQPGKTLIVDVDGGGDQTFTFAGTQGHKTGSGGTFSGLDSTTLKLHFPDGVVQTVTFDSSAVDAASTALEIDAQIVGGHADVNAGQVEIFCDIYGTSSQVTIDQANSAAGFASTGAGTAGTGDGANLGALTSAELITKLSTLTGSTAALVAGAPTITSTTTGTSSTVTIKNTSTVTGQLAYSNWVSTAGANAGPGDQPTQTFASAGADFVADGTQAGDILVTGVISGAGALGADAFTLRVVEVVDLHTLTVEQMDGSDFNWSTTTGLPWRIHVRNTADSSSVPGSIADGNDTDNDVPARPLDASISANTVLAPTLPQPAPTATAWSPLSGLGSISGSLGVTYTAAVQAPNAVASASFDALYSLCFDALLSTKAPSKNVNILVSSRSSALIRSLMKQHEVTASSQGIGRISVIAPPLASEGATSTLVTNNILSDTAPGVGAQRDEGIDYAWPGARTFVPEAVNFKVATSDGGTTTDGILDTKFDVWCASIMSNLAPEKNPGEESETVAGLTGAILDFQRGAPDLGINEYIALKQAGVMALVQEPNGFFIEEGITTSLVPGEQNANRIRFQYFLQDSAAGFLKPFSKQVLTDDLKDSELAAVVAFSDGLLSENQPSFQRIAGYSVDGSSGNTPALLAAGIYSIIWKVRMLPTQDEIVLLTQVGTDVVVTPSGP